MVETCPSAPDWFREKHGAAGPLYVVHDQSDSMHDCCFQATVVRRDLPMHTPEWSICEAHNIADAQRIADALNAALERETLPPDQARKYPPAPE